jgi:protoporphyrinogen IX oxidase
LDTLIIALSLHVAFLLIWSAGLVYMPVLFLQHAAAADPDSRRRMMLMQRWLYASIMTPAALLAVAAGTWLLFERGFSGGWLHVKLALVLLMTWFHIYCGHVMANFKRIGSRHGRAYFLVMPAVPAALVVAIVWLVTGKPF